ncbi:MAG: imidazolonepropionase [Acidobacteria bacterium]|nr:MAG: imidazolonepropionase [Acidobacteriota bacterium]
MALLLTHATQLLTLAGPDRARRGTEMNDLGLVRDGAVLIDKGQIVAAGPNDAVAARAPSGVATHDCSGMLVTPGLCDPHTHLVFAAPRMADYERRLAGTSYQEIAAAGGGIRSSLEAVRTASESDLTHQAAFWIRQARAAGTTTIEVKSGYGLTVEAECKSLRAAHAAALAAGGDVAPTFLGAHIVPPEFVNDRARYVALVSTTMLDAVCALGDAAPEFADVFCDPSAFTLAESRQILEAARARDLQLKLHAEQFAPMGGIGLGIELGAVSVDHCDAARAADAALLGRAETVATLIPGANFFLGQTYAPARMLIEAGAAVALATDFNPGTCPILSLPLVMSIACNGMRLTPAEAWTAVTINGAAALARAGICGSLAPGKRADLAIFAAGDYRAIPYYAGQNLCRAVVQNGVWIESHGHD